MTAKEIKNNPAFIELEKEWGAAQKKCDDLIREINEKFNQNESFYFWGNASYAVSISRINLDIKESLDI